MLFNVLCQIHFHSIIVKGEGKVNLPRITKKERKSLLWFLYINTSYPASRSNVFLSSLKLLFIQRSLSHTHPDLLIQITWLTAVGSDQAGLLLKSWFDGHTIRIQQWVGLFSNLASFFFLFLLFLFLLFVCKRKMKSFSVIQEIRFGIKGCQGTWTSSGGCDGWRLATDLGAASPSSDVRVGRRSMFVRLDEIGRFQEWRDKSVI